jgi:hypothetical protein
MSQSRAISTTIDQEVIEYFRCPEAFATFQLNGYAEASTGYFRFRDAICFGRSLAGSSQNVTESAAYEVWPNAFIDGGEFTLAFLPGEVAQNFRFERYVTNPPRQGWSTKWAAVQRQAYYAVRPLLGVSVRKHFQRRALRGWDEIPFPAWPVDRTVDRVFESFLELSLKAHGVDRVPFIWFWPHGHQSCTIMTHDVEEAEGVRACDAVMDLDSAVQLAASFQLVPEGRYSFSAAVLDGIRGRGFEVNIHDLNHDGHLYDDRDEFLRRAEKVNAYVKEYDAKGFRSAVLYRNVSWYDAFDFAYDMSVPSVAHLDPQRGGCCTIMPYFVGNIVELPLTTTQDYSLFNILEDYSIELWKRQADYIIQNHGLLSFNVHPDYLDSALARSAYTALLQHLAALRAERRTYFARPDEVDRWWRERSQMTLARESGQWRIQGAGSQRAVIAYACAGRDGLTYSFEQTVV